MDEIRKFKEYLYSGSVISAELSDANAATLKKWSVDTAEKLLLFDNYDEEQKSDFMVQLLFLTGAISRLVAENLRGSPFWTVLAKFKMLDTIIRYLPLVINSRKFFDVSDMRKIPSADDLLDLILTKITFK
jgi:hypothetical protein